MGNAISSVGDLLGNAFMAPLKSIFGQSCQGICSGPWDLLCFIEHLCVSNILRLILILALCYIALLFFYILFKLGLCQCIGKSLCRMCWGACEMYWFALEDISCFLWHKLLSTKRVNRRCRRRSLRRRRFRDIEQGRDYSSSEETEYETDFSSPHSIDVTRNNEYVNRRQRARIRGSLRTSYRGISKGREVFSVRVKDGSRRVRLSQTRNTFGKDSKAKTFKRRRIK